MFRPSTRRVFFVTILATLTITICTTRFFAAEQSLKINESAIRANFDDEKPRVLFAVENRSNNAVSVRVRLELINPHDYVYFRSERDEIIKPGASTLDFSLNRTAVDPDRSLNELLWYRLRYTITYSQSSDSQPLPTLNGIISVSEITPEIFELQVFVPGMVKADAELHARARTLHPITGKPVSGVKIEGLMETDDEDHPLKISGITDATGYATLIFKTPKEYEDDQLPIKFTATRGQIKQEAEAEDINFDSFKRILLHTDKPLYQPGQTLHICALLFDQNSKALANAEAELTITDPENTKVFRTELKTSRFGVANVDWQIPDNIRLGEYEIELECDDSQNTKATKTVKISRYDLPTFIVNVKPDKGYYLPGQNAEVEVRADYLFGQPVKKGKVKVVREEERRWNYREQRYDVIEKDKYEGETDAEGRFVAHVKLDDAHEHIADQDYERFEDVSYAAYFTDETTGRTEQRRFDIRVTKEEIHVYVIEIDRGLAPNFPTQFYVSTSYADGTPVSCDVAISKLVELDDDSIKATPLATVKTNNYGLARVIGLRLTDNENTDSEIGLGLKATDQNGKTGNHTEKTHWEEKPLIRVETDKSLYRPGEPIRAVITSNAPNLKVLVDIAQDGHLMKWHDMQLREGRAEILVPYQREFQNLITISAFSRNKTDSNVYFPIGSRAVLYPHDDELKLEVLTKKTTYQPNEEALIEVRARTSDKRAAQSVIGAVVIDRAVEERARTDGEFKGRFGFDSYFYHSGRPQSFAGFTLNDLKKIDLSKPLPNGFELVAEVVLSQMGGELNWMYSGDDFTTDQNEAFGPTIKLQLKPIETALETQYKERGVYPKDKASLENILTSSQINFADFRDPWGTPYLVEFSTETQHDLLTFICAGADKQFDTADDFSVLTMKQEYFRFVGEAMKRAVERYQARTSDYVRDEITLKAELKREGIDFDSLRDPWGQPYSIGFRLGYGSYSVHVQSTGPDRRAHGYDDFIVWSTEIDFVSGLRRKLSPAIDAYFAKHSRLPANEAELNEALQAGGIDIKGLLDPLGRPYYFTFASRSGYADSLRLQTQATYGQPAKLRTEIKPVTQKTFHVNVRGIGEDGKEGTWDDFDVTSFSRIISEQAADEPKPQPVISSTPKIINPTPGATGAITGVVTDPQQNAIASVSVKATNSVTAAVFEARTDESGKFLLQNLPAGLYEVVFEASGFKSFRMSSVPVKSSVVTQLDVSLEVGTTSETVTVTASAVALQTTTAESSSIVVNGRNFTQLVSIAPRVTMTAKSDIETPRLREYFPETLLWQPEIQTDAKGRAQLRFKLADNITTWKLSLIGSTIDGQIGTVEKEIRAFMPFFAELDPPKVLTEGDEISLPVVLRNYLDKAQAVDLQMKPENWFSLLGPARKRSEVQSNDSARETFDFRAVASVKNGKQRVTAIGTSASDAIEKPVNVHPDGEELAQTSTQVFDQLGTLEINVPDYAIKNTPHAELKIYPNLMAHLLEGIEGILQRPYGCGEQTISSTYPNVMALKYLQSNPTVSPSREKAMAMLKARAEKYAQAGYERLLGYRAQGGGFTYWGRGDADLALTAYALRFLNDAREVINVDEKVIEETRDWLIKQQQSDGRWPTYSWWNKEEETRRTMMNTAIIARSVARAVAANELKRKTQNTNVEDAKSIAARLAMSRAFDYLAAQTAEIDEPYAIAAYALAAIEAGEKERTAWAIEKLRTLARDEAGGAYWNLETNTPFYGWGTAGRVETSALAVKALALGGEDRDKELIGRGLHFLMRNKDRYGVWYSTQATINVLDSFITLNTLNPTGASHETTAEIFVNNRRATSVVMPPNNQFGNPITVDLSPYLSTGANRVEIKRSAEGALATAQVVETHYIPWAKSAATQSENFRPGTSSAMRLVVNFDKTEAKVGDEITCRVEAERIGYSGYGMMLTEIGLPPGAEVQRESLEKAVKEAGWSVSQYDVLPDRVILYLWPRAGGTTCEFKFKTRFGIKALSSASTLYDYYNPEARALVAPVKFVIQ